MTRPFRTQIAALAILVAGLLVGPSVAARDDVIQAKVINVSRDDKKIGLSIRKLEESTEKDSYRSYLNNQREATSNLGQLLSEKMMNLERRNLAADRGTDEDDES